MTDAIVTSEGSPVMLGGKVGLFQSVDLPPVEVPGPTTGTFPTTSLVGRWNITALAPGGGVAQIPDTSGSNRIATTTPSAKVYARQAGLLAGVYYEKGPFTYTPMHPYIQDFAVNVASAPVGTGQMFTVFLVWSRPKQRQPDLGATSTADVSLLKIGGVDVLSMTALGNGADTLKLFPAGAPVTGGTLELRHTHTTRVVFSGSTVDVWLDGVKVITAAANQITLGTTAALSFLNAAQCVFHEAAAYSKALTVAEHAELTGYQLRYPLGPRRAAFGLLIGQSNADNFITLNAYLSLNRAVAYWTGALSSTVLYGYGALAGGNTTFSGKGLYSILDSSSGGANVANWPLLADGNNLMTAIDSMTPDQKANLRYVAWFWSESDTRMLTYANKATYTGAMKRILSMIRARVGVSAADLPVLFINALAFTPDEGAQTHREVMQDLVNDASMNCKFMLTQSSDGTGQGTNWDSNTGLESGTGNSAHRDTAALQSYAHRMAMPIARAVLAANTTASTPDAITTIDASVPASGGPRIVSATYEGTTYEPSGSVLVTVAHDGGNDLSLPLRAVLGVGWTLMDGVSSSAAGNPAAPGALITATACTRVSATQLRVTLAALPTYPAKAQLYYPYGDAMDPLFFSIIGRGNAVIDNFASVTLTAGWRINTDMGAGYQPNQPLQATTYGIGLT